MIRTQAVVVNLVVSMSAPTPAFFCCGTHLPLAGEEYDENQRKNPGDRV